MVARRRWRRRLAAGGAGVAINAGALFLLTLERTTPPRVDPPVMEISLAPREMAPRQVRLGAQGAPPARGRPTPPVLVRSSRGAAAEVETAPAALTASERASAQDVEPRWRVGSGDYLDPATARRARQTWRAAEKRRLRRACLGLSEEHMTDAEKAACWDAWGGGAPIRALAPEPTEVRR
jgi:hypothetical protein